MKYQEYHEVIRGQLEEQFAQEGKNIETAAKYCAESVKSGRVIHVFGCGHSQMFAMEVLQLEDTDPRDTMIVVSISGRNAGVVDMALEAKAIGMKVIALTSRQFSSSTTSRHSSGKHLADVADVVIDVKCVSGDAALSMDGLEPHFCGTSTVLGMGNALGGRIGAMVSGFVYGLELILFSGFTYSLFNHFAAVGAEGTGHDCIDAMALMTIMKNPVVGIIIIVGAFILASVLVVRYQKKVAEKSQAA